MQLFLSNVFGEVKDAVPLSVLGAVIPLAAADASTLRLPKREFQGNIFPLCVTICIL